MSLQSIGMGLVILLINQGRQCIPTIPSNQSTNQTKEIIFYQSRARNLCKFRCLSDGTFGPMCCITHVNESTLIVNRRGLPWYWMVCCKPSKDAILMGLYSNIMYNKQDLKLCMVEIRYGKICGNIMTISKLFFFQIHPNSFTDSHYYMVLSQTFPY